MTFLYFFILSKIYFTNASISNCFRYDSIVHRDQYMPRHVYRRVDVTSAFDCASLCVNSALCKSFSFGIKKPSCHLNSANSTDGTVENRPGVLFSDKHDWPEEVSGPCMQKKCSPGNTCAVDRLHRPQCVKEFSGCGTPPAFPSGSPIHDGHYQGAVATYACPVNYMSCNTSCLVTAQWEDVISDCVRNKWTNTIAPLRSESVFCRDTKNFTITMTATPRSKLSVVFNLKKASDILLHVAANHPSAKYDQHVTVFNAYIDGRWQGIQTSDLVPVRKDVQFTLQIDFGNGVYKVKQNGIDVISFPEKKRGVLSEWFDIVGDVQIHSVEVKARYVIPSQERKHGVLLEWSKFTSWG